MCCAVLSRLAVSTCLVFVLSSPLRMACRQIVSGWNGKDTTEVVYPDIVDMVYVWRFFGRWEHGVFFGGGARIAAQTECISRDPYRAVLCFLGCFCLEDVHMGIGTPSLLKEIELRRSALGVCDTAVRVQVFIRTAVENMPVGIGTPSSHAHCRKNTATLNVWLAPAFVGR